MPRPARKRGHSCELRGISKDKVCVACAVNRTGQSIAKVSNLGRITTNHLHKIFDNRIKSGTFMCTDNHSAYPKFANKNEIEHIQLKGGKSSLGIYHIQHINSYHKRLKEFLYPFHGVSTKYLNNYLIWHNFVNYAKESKSEKEKILLNCMIKSLTNDIRNKLSDRPCLPLVS